MPTWPLYYRYSLCVSEAVKRAPELCPVKWHLEHEHALHLDTCCYLCWVKDITETNLFIMTMNMTNGIRHTLDHQEKFHLICTSTVATKGGPSQELYAQSILYPAATYYDQRRPLPAQGDTRVLGSPG
jgi:hypothetical protein